MKCKRRLRGKMEKNKIRKFMVSVNNYVQSQGGHSGAEHYEQIGQFVKKKSRKELRKEKRKLKKKKKRSHLTGTPSSPTKKSAVKATRDEQRGNPGGDTGETIQAATTPRPGRDADERKRKVHFQTLPPQRKKAKLDMARKRALLEANVVEDKEIKKLEKRLGLNKRRNKQSLPQSFVSDGLDYILGILDPGASGTGLYDSGDEDVCAAKAKTKLEKLNDLSDVEEAELDTSGEDKDSSVHAGPERDLDAMSEEEDETEEQDSEINAEEEGVTASGKQPVKSGEGETSGDRSCDGEQPSAPEAGKYVPPYLREAAESKRKAELERLQRSLKGLMNRLSEPNLGSISGQLEELYMSYSRKDMNDVLTEVLLAACVTPSLMPDRLLMEHMLLLSVIHHTVGLEVGAHFLETVVRRFDDTHHQGTDAGKECDNLVCMIAHLYNFQVVHSVLVFDLLRCLLASFSTRDLELVLLLLKTVGFTLRKDNPLALKELISEAQRKASTEAPCSHDQTRVRFMLETMLALKNNDMRKIPGYDPEPAERLKKLHRTLVQHRAGGTDVKLRVSLENLLEADQVGRWWIVGSSWSGAPMIGDHDNKPATQPATGQQFSSKVMDLARKQRMNTDVRRNIFCVIMTSEDYLDAFEKLLRLGLKGQQERDIVHVLLDCCLQEKSFNSFYAVLAEKFCTHDRRFQMTFQFCLWDKFKDLATLCSTSFNNLVLLVTHLLQRNSLSLSILKAIEFGELDKPKMKFLKQILSKLLQQTQPEDLVHIFSRISGIPKLGMLREGLKLFIQHFLLCNKQTQETEPQTALLTARAEVAIKAMEARDTKLKL
ncbi:nucleolar MIF4G domain-containing protein 1 [Electrophorus electricus]|uniref:Nucleolar MIF4G domain-containing protein 1 n=1 Tax=Electrophorus electricus TaxID=8005 RepID=A0A4W4FRF1_ELEEL|nr:nucleolar MIF4G domain-containing protein 1 [Electrophorus electricus]